MKFEQMLGVRVQVPEIFGELLFGELSFMPK